MGRDGKDARVKKAGIAVDRFAEMQNEGMHGSGGTGDGNRQYT